MAMSARSTFHLMVAAIAALLMPVAVPAKELQVLRTEGGTITFNVALEQGLFEKYGIQIENVDSGTGAAMIESFARGEIDVIDGGLDNGIAASLNGIDTLIVTGSSLAEQELIAQPGIKSVQDLRGRIIVVDSTNMQAALVLKKMLLLHGLSPRDYQLKVVGAKRLAAMRANKDYAAAMLAGTQAAVAKQEGFVSLGKSLDAIGPVTYHGAFVRRSWARENSDLLSRYIAAEVEAQRWILAPANKQKMVEIILKSSVSGTTVSMAEDTYQEMVSGPGALTKDIELHVPALQNFLRLRAQVEASWGGSPPPAESLYDLSYYNQALALVSKGSSVE